MTYLAYLICTEKKLSGATEKITDGIVDIETLEIPTGYRIIDMDILTVVCCPDCGANLKLLETKKQSISFHLQTLRC